MEKRELYYDLASTRRSEQVSIKSQIEFKAMGIIGLGATLVGLAGLTAQEPNPNPS